MRAIVVEQVGGPEVLKLVERPSPEPGPGQVRVRVRAIGVNFVDVYHRTGRYSVPLPFTPGSEAAGEVAALGPDVTGLKKGDRVVWANSGKPNAYAEEAVVDAEKLVRVPDGLDFVHAAGALLQGMTARFLTHQTFKLEKGHVALVHAAAGGVGLWLCQMAREAGARVIGTVGSEDKAKLARDAGAHEVILYQHADIASEVKRLTDGAKCHVVYDGVGATTWAASLDALRPRGMFVLFGGASGPVPPIDPLLLTQKGSLFMTRPSMGHYLSTRDELLALATPVLEGLARQRYAMRVDRTLPLADAAEAHRLLESRETAGKLVLTT